MVASLRLRWQFPQQSVPDLLVVVRPDIDWVSLRPFEYNAASKRMIRRLYGFDAHTYSEESAGYRRLLNFFQDVRPDAPYTTKTRKGVLRMVL